METLACRFVNIDFDTRYSSKVWIEEYSRGLTENQDHGETDKGEAGGICLLENQEKPNARFNFRCLLETSGTG